MKKSFITLMFLLSIGTVKVIKPFYAYPYGYPYGYPYYGYPYAYPPYGPYYGDEGALIAGNLIGGFGGIMGAAIASSEARKADERAERIARLQLEREKIKKNK